MKLTIIISQSLNRATLVLSQRLIYLAYDVPQSLRTQLLQTELLLERKPPLKVYPPRQQHPAPVLTQRVLAKLVPYPPENLVGSADGLVQVRKGRDSLGLVGSDEFREALFALDRLFDSREVLLIVEVAFLDLVKGLFLGLVLLVGLLVEYVTIALHLLEKPETHLQVVHLKFDQIVNEHLVQIIRKLEALMNLPKLLHDDIG